MATEPERLRAEVAALRAVVAELVDQLPSQVETEVAAKTVPRAELDARLRASGKRVAVGFVLVLVLIIAGVGINRVTLHQAQDRSIQDLRALILTCRTTTPTISPADLAYCQKRIPGFQQARANARKVAETAARNERRLRRLEADVAGLLE
jgi:hypothetical protein